MMAKKYLDRFSRVLALVVVVVFLTIASPGFLDRNNVLNILNQASLNVFIACGLTLTMLITGIDLSAGSILALTSCLAGSFFRSGSYLEMLIGLVVALGLGFFLGGLNGAAVSYLNLPPFLVTFGMQQIARGFAYLYMKGTIVNNFHERFLFWGKGDVLGIPTPVLVAAAVVLLLGFMLTRTTLGRQIYTVGSNRSAAKYSGISIHKTTIFAFGMSGMIAALAGLIYISRLNAAEAVIGEEFAQQAIAAAAIGGISFKGGSGSIYGTVIGALLLTVILNGMNRLGIPTQYQDLVTGIVIIGAVLMDRKSAKIRV